MFALYASHPTQNVPFGAPLVQSYDWTGGIGGVTLAEPPVSSVTLQAGEVYWIALDFGPDEGGSTAPYFYPSGTTTGSVVARTLLTTSNSNINLQDGPTTITTALLAGLAGGATTVLPSLHIVVQDIE